MLKKLEIIDDGLEFGKEFDDIEDQPADGS